MDMWWGTVRGRWSRRDVKAEGGSTGVGVAALEAGGLYTIASTESTASLTARTVWYRHLAR